MMSAVTVPLNRRRCGFAIRAVGGNDVTEIVCYFRPLRSA